MKEIIEKLAKFENLSGVEMTDVIERIVTGRVTEAQIASLLLALKMKGETPEERTAIAQVMRGHAQHIPTEIHDAMDNCGTGGDKSFSFNISQLQPLSWLVAVFTWPSMVTARFLLNLVPQMSSKPWESILTSNQLN
ncbi:anthranilate phosphoribosyltransferase [Streptococcus pneumoniae]|nr:anthranilate phosphoribosyltransferase [Streptococcus pneumoniae]SNG32529.1 anthranilate phosphoribosyltransferase [Streptococcus pneumoniae]